MATRPPTNGFVTQGQCREKHKAWRWFAGAAIVATVALASWIFATALATEGRLTGTESTVRGIDARLTRIENKLDRLLEGQ